MKTLAQHLHDIHEKAVAFPWNADAIAAFNTAVNEALRDQRYMCAEQACDECHALVGNAYLTGVNSDSAS